MNEIKYISSVQNALIKETLLLKEKSKKRKESGLFVLEGQRELLLALKGNYMVKTLFFHADIIALKTVEEFLKPMSQRTNIVEVSKEVYQKIAYRGTTEGVVALVESKTHSLDQLKLKEGNPLILVAEAPEKPGNIGALLRTVDAANLDAFIVANPKTDVYNPNIIRSSVGCIFTTPIAIGNTAEIITYLKEKKIAFYGAALTASKKYTDMDFTGASAIVVGTEATGLTNDWLDSASQNILIPMQGEIDSLNVSVSAAILIFEAKRQREFG